MADWSLLCDGLLQRRWARSRPARARAGVTGPTGGMPSGWSCRPCRVLSDDHNYEHGLTTLIDLVDRIVRANGATALRDVELGAVARAGHTLQRIPQEQGRTARTWWTYGSPNERAARSLSGITPKG